MSAPVPVTLHPGTGGVFSAAELDEELPDAPAPAAGDHEVPDAEPVDLEQLPEHLAAIVREPVNTPPDRSSRTMALVCAFQRAGFTVGQTLEAANCHAPSVSKYGPRLPKEIGRAWAKAVKAAEDEVAQGDDEPDKSDRKSQATLLVELAESLFDLGVTDTGEPFAVRRDGARLALQLRGGRTSLRATMAAEFYAAHSKAPSASALADALSVIEGRAAACDPVELPLRVASHEQGVVIDLGGPDGHAVVVTPSGWTVVDRSPVLFRRTNLTMPLPVPIGADGDADPLVFLRDLNADEHQLRLLVGWLIAALVPDIPHPVLALFGEQGTGKSTAGRVIGETIDPTAAPLRSAPRHEDQWQVAAAGSWAVVLDNLSAVQPWLSDALCRAVTGDGAVKRQLYTDADVSVLRFRRCVVMTSIDAGALKGDLAERLLPIELERIDPTARRTEADIVAAFEQHHPRLLGDLLSLLAQVLEVLPGVELDELPRMADFARLLAALDIVTGWSTLPAFMGVGDTLAEDVIDADPVAQAVVALVDRDGSWTGSTAALLREITDTDARLPKDWPTTPNVLSGRLKRCATALRQVGIVVEQGHGRTRRTWTLTRTEKPGSGPSPSSPPSPASHRNGSRRDDPEPETVTGDDETVTRDDPQPDTVTEKPAPAQACDDGDDGDDQTTLCSVCGIAQRGSFSGPECVDCSSDHARHAHNAPTTPDYSSIDF